MVSIKFDNAVSTLQNKFCIYVIAPKIAPYEYPDERRLLVWGHLYTRTQVPRNKSMSWIICVTWSKNNLLNSVNFPKIYPQKFHKTRISMKMTLTFYVCVDHIFSLQSSLYQCLWLSQVCGGVHNFIYKSKRQLLLYKILAVTTCNNNNNNNNNRLFHNCN